MRKISVLLLFVIGTSVSIAQDVEVVNSPRCWLDSSSFSPGIVIGNGTRTLVCDTSETWIKSDLVALGCIFKGDFYSTGAQLKVTDKNADTIIQCDADGIWTGIDSNE